MSSRLPIGLAAATLLLSACALAPPLPRARLATPGEPPPPGAAPALCAGAGLPCRARLAAQVEAEPGRGDALRELAWTDFLDGALEQARGEMARAARLLPGDPRVLLGQALLDEEEGRAAAAMEGFLRLLERAPGEDPWAAAAQLEAATEVGRLALEVKGASALSARLAALDEGALADELRDRVLAVRARLRRRSGDEAAAQRLDAERGCPAQVGTFGPYGSLATLDLERPFPLDAVDPPGGGVRAPGRACLFAVVTPQGRRGVAYAVAYVRVSRPQTARVKVVTERPYHLVVDGKTVFRQAPIDRWPAAATELDVPLPAGLHRFALKLSAAEPRTLATLRFAPAAGLTVLDGPPGPRERARAGSALSAAPHLEPVLGAAAAADQPRLALWLWARRALDAFDVDAAEQLAARLDKEAPRFVPGLLLSAEVDAADPSRPRRVARDRARRHYERVLALEPACVTARYQLVDYDLDEEHPDRALQRLNSAPAGASWRLGWARYRALHARDWDVEAERALAQAELDNPEACPLLEGEVQVALDRHDPQRAVEAARALSRCSPESEQLADLLRGEVGEPAAAAVEYRRLLALDPTRESALRGLGEALSQLGDGAAAAEVWRKLAAMEPRTATWRRHLADALLQSGDSAGARQALLDGLAQSPEAQELHRALAAIGGPGAMDAFRLDGRKVIADFEASGRSYPTPAVIVLDRTVVRVFWTGARLTLTHNIMRVQTKDGIDKFGEVNIPDGADVLLLRAVKADGSTREAQEIVGKRSVSVPDLAPGDFVEFEYIEPAGAPLAFPGGFYSERFFFSSFDAPLDRTELVVATPAGMPLQIDARGPAPTPRLGAIEDPLGGEVGRLDVRTWADRVKAQLVPEPQQAPFSEYVPSVRVASGVSFAAWRDFLVDGQFGNRRQNRELRELAHKLGTPTAIDLWVRRHIRQGGALDEAATSVLARGEGNRVVLERALLLAAGIDADIWLVRGRNDAQLDGALPDLEAFDEPVLAIAGSSSGRTARPDAPVLSADAAAAPLVIDPRFRHTPTGFVAPLLRGERALVLDGSRSREARFVTVPGGFEPGAEAERAITLSAAVARDGSAEVTVRERLTGWPALEWREGLDRIDESRVRAEFEQHTLGFYFPGATLTALEVAPRDADDDTLHVDYRFHAPRFARLDGDRLVLGAPYPALLGKRYVGVAERRTPLQLSFAASTSVDALIQLPAGASVTTSPAVTLPGFGQFSQSVAVEEGAIRLRGRFALPPDRVPPGRYGEFVRWADAVDRAESRAAAVDFR